MKRFLHLLDVAAESFATGIGIVAGIIFAIFIFALVIKSFH